MQQLRGKFQLAVDLVAQFFGPPLHLRVSNCVMHILNISLWCLIERMAFTMCVVRIARSMVLDSRDVVRNSS